MKEKITDELMEKGVKLIIPLIKILNQKLTDREAENIIISVGAYLELKRLKEKTV